MAPFTRLYARFPNGRILYVECLHDGQTALDDATALIMAGAVRVVLTHLTWGKGDAEWSFDHPAPIAKAARPRYAR